MSHYRGQLEKINDGRGRQDEVIDEIKKEIGETESKVQDLETAIRS